MKLSQNRAYLLWLCFVYICCPAFAAQDTLYMNGPGQVASRNQAQYYRLIEAAGTSIYRITDHFMNGRIKCIAHTGGPQAAILEGAYMENDSLGNLFCSGNYHKGFPTGEWLFYHPFSHSIREKRSYINTYEYKEFRYDRSGMPESEGVLDRFGRRTGQWLQYFEGSDKIKLVSNYLLGKKEGEQLEYNKNGQVKRKEIYHMGKFSDGWQYNEDGKDVDYFPAFVYPKYKEYLSAYLHRSAPCVTELLKTNDLELALVISAEGIVLEAFVDKVESPECAKVIKEALLKMKKWKPALWENKAIKYRFETRVKHYTARE